MDYRTAYENLSKAFWKYEGIHSDAWVALLLAVREIDKAVTDNAPRPFIKLAPEDNEPE